MERTAMWKLEKILEKSDYNIRYGLHKPYLSQKSHMEVIAGPSEKWIKRDALELWNGKNLRVSWTEKKSDKEILKKWNQTFVRSSAVNAIFQTCDEDTSILGESYVVGHPHEQGAGGGEASAVCGGWMASKV